MCGIVCVLNTDGAPASSSTVHQMSERILHRGPDGSGHWTKDNVAMGHRRLSIIDLTDGGSQPMQTQDGRYTISYNGEVYNFADIRIELKAAGVHFVSRSDTEVVLKAIAQWGIKAACQRFNGMFALVCYDAQKRQLLVGRDRYGIKPLYVCQIENAILFASEIKAFLGHPKYRHKLDNAGLVEYFTFQNFVTERTLYQNVSMFPPGHTAEVSCTADAQVSPEQYWDFDFREPPSSEGQAHSKDELLFLFRQAVSRQLISDVEVSSYLSGGMDSGAITAVAADLLPSLRTFTCGFDLTSASGVELNFDERALAERMSYLFRTEHYEVVLKSGDMERAIPELVHHLDEPRVGQSYPNFYVAGLASKFSKVVLGGTGGDELFGGYPWRYSLVANAQSMDEFVQSYFGFWQRMVKSDQYAKVFAPIWNDAKHVDPQALFRSVLDNHEVDFQDPSAAMNLAQYFDAKTFLHGLLTVEDKLSMAHSMESRVPFLDNDLVDYAQCLPGKMKVRGLHMEREMNQRNAQLGTEAVRQFQKTNDGKIALREMMGELLPAEIVDAQKQGFSAPDASWFRGDSIDFVRANLLDPSAAIYSALDFSAVQPLLEKHFHGEENQRLLIWSLLSVNQLLEKEGLTA